MEDPNANGTEMRGGVCLYPSETVVFEAGPWGIITDTRSGGGGGDNEGNTYATHRCKEDCDPHDRVLYGEYCWVDRGQGEEERCEWCGDDVPAGIIALIRLDNWDK